MEMLKKMQEKIAEAGQLLKVAVAEVWLAAVVVAGFEFLGAGPGGFAACADALLKIMVVKHGLKWGSRLQQMGDRLEKMGDRLEEMGDCLKDEVVTAVQAGQCLIKRTCTA